MREIKFRVWDDENEEMVYEVGVTPEGIPYTIPGHNESFDAFDYYPHCHKMQYTGLKDKDGQEIYEGDVVKGYNRIFENASYRYEVRFLNGCYMFGNWNAHEYFNKHQKIEVIGNIYETSELLEVAQ